MTAGLAQAPVVAQLGGRPAEEWVKTLDSPTRIAGLKVDETVERLKLKPGDVVADIGAGSGIFEGSLAKAVAPGGKVFAVDIDQGLLDAIEKRTQEFKLTNVQTVLGKFTDPSLPTHEVDLAFINDTLHHIENRAEYLKNLAGYMKPSGRIAVIDYIPGKGGHPDQPELQVSKEQAAAWMAAVGMKPVEEIDLFDTKWFVVYAKQ
ncbi:MAG: methyltransferase domain-containing protein [Acidobacteria bacterium]|nr:methyltransferase domain-containing protein [Acidobacteriota bacterium]